MINSLSLALAATLLAGSASAAVWAPARPAARPAALPVLPLSAVGAGLTGASLSAAPAATLRAPGLSAIPQAPVAPAPEQAAPAAAVRRAEVPIETIASRSDAVLWGEDHFSSSSLEWLAANMPRLKAAGVTHLALENLWLSAEADLRDFLEGRRSDIPEEAFFDERLEELRSLYQAAGAAGVRVIALQRPFEEWFVEIAALASRHPGIPPAYLSDPEALARFMFRADQRRIPGLNEAIAEVAMTRRNAFMASRIKDALGPGEKALVLAGYAHLEHPEGMGVERVFGVPAAPLGNLAGELDSLGLRPFSIALTGGRMFEAGAPPLDPRLQAEAFRRLARAGGDPAQEIFLETSERTAIFHMGPSR